jgi:ketosteroid isomerase-like protein
MASTENAEIVSRAFQAAENGGFEAAAAFMHEDFEMTQIPGWPGALLCRGWEEATREFVEWVSSFDDFRWRPERFTAVGGDLVVVDLHEWGRPRGGGVEIDQLWAVLFTLREDKIARWEWFASPAEAQHAAAERGGA